MKVYNESKFNMWRACFAALWADGKLTSEEREWALKKINTLRFTDEQKQALLEELETQADFLSIVEKVTNKSDRAFLAHQIRVISHLDGHFSPEEKELLENWRSVVMQGVEDSKIKELLALDALDEEERADEVANKSSLFERAFRTAQKFFT
jgi:tellurite resistance protein